MGISPASTYYCCVEDVAPWASLLHPHTTVVWRTLHYGHLSCICTLPFFSDGMCVFSQTCTCLYMLKARGLQCLPLPLSILFFETRIGSPQIARRGASGPTGSGATVTIPKFMWVLWI